MRLFTAKDVVTNQQHESQLELNRLKSTTELLEARRKELKDFEIDFEYALKQQEEKWEEIKTEKTKEINDLKAQVLQLEARRKANLTPLEYKKEEIDALEKKIKAKELSLKKKEDDYEERIELLENKLTELADREQTIDIQNKLHARAQKGIDAQRAQVALQAKGLSKSMEDSYKEDRIRKNEIVRLQSILDLKEKALVDKEKEIANREAGFADREKAIKDRYETLERAIKQSHLDIVI